MHERTYTDDDHEWDPEKAAANLAKHGVRFSDAATVLEDELALTIPDSDVLAEDRFLTLGADAAGRLLVVVWAPRGDRIRLISARLAMSWERRMYEEAP